MSEIGTILSEKGFYIKELISNKTCKEKTQDTCELAMGTESSNTEGVLGLKWNFNEDLLLYKVNLSTDIEDVQLTKRVLLSVTNSIFDSLGFLTPFTFKAKAVIRDVWAYYPELGWDSKLPESIAKNWEEIIVKMPELTKLRFQRGMKPKISAWDPILVIFSDGSELAFGAVAYLRW